MTRAPRRDQSPRTYEQLVAYVEERGYSVVSGKHRRVLRPNGSLLFRFPSSPSDNRGARNAFMTFKRATRDDI